MSYLLVSSCLLGVKGGAGTCLQSCLLPCPPWSSLSEEVLQESPSFVATSHDALPSLHVKALAKHQLPSAGPSTLPATANTCIDFPPPHPPPPLAGSVHGTASTSTLWCSGVRRWTWGACRRRRGTSWGSTTLGTSARCGGVWGYWGGRAGGRQGRWGLLLIGSDDTLKEGNSCSTWLLTHIAAHSLVTTANL